MILLAGFLDVLLRAFEFIGLALSVGGVAFRWVALRPVSPSPGTLDFGELSRTGEGRGGRGGGFTSALRRCALLIGIGAFLGSFSQLGAMVVSASSLIDEAGHWPWGAFLATSFAHAALLHAGLAFLLGMVAVLLHRRAQWRDGWLLATLLALAVMASGAPLTHGASRLTNPRLLMTVTVLHQLPSLVWVGGVVHLAAQWRGLRSSSDPGPQTENSKSNQPCWPLMVVRFSPLALACVAGLVVAGCYLAYQYVCGVHGLIGTAYGAMLLTKVALMGAALCLGGLNFLACRAFKREGRRGALLWRVPVLVETEAAIGLCILMAAAAFTGQPPAIDVQPEWAAPREVAESFAPKVPRFTMPPYQQMLATSTLALDPYSLPAPLEKLQSDFNHNLSGAFVLAAGLGALLYRLAGARWARHWPLVFAPLGLFVLVIGEPTIWPMGSESLWATLAAPEVLVHRLASFMVIALALFEWRASAGRLGQTRARYVFPLICLIGGAMLLGHSHSIFVTKWAFLIEVSHNALGIFAVFAGAARLLELRLPEGDRGAPAVIWPVCLALIGVVLLFYRET